MLTVWTKNLKTEEERTNFMNQVLGAKPVLERLVEILNEKEEQLERSERTLDAYDNPNWAYKQAHKNGYLSVLQNLRDTINLDQQKDRYEPTYKHPQRQP